MDDKVTDQEIRDRLNEAYGEPPADALAASRQAVAGWFDAAAPLIRWDMFQSPLGPLYAALSDRGLYHVAFRVDQDAFFAGLDPLARTRRDPGALASTFTQLRAYFEEPSQDFDLPVDLSTVTDFQRRALQAIRAIPAGRVWTYKRVAEEIGRPNASRAIGQAMARNPVPIVIPCHRIVGSSGRLTGYGGGGGIATKRYLLELEGAL